MTPTSIAVVWATLAVATSLAAPEEPRVSLFPTIQTYVDKRVAEFDRIPAPRREQLAQLAKFVASQAKAGKPVRLTFVCTHNSRRSHIAQLWAQIAAARYGVAGVHAYSGGTEATAFNPRAVDAMRRAGFKIEKTTSDDNPIYHVRHADAAPPLSCFSKVYSHAPNPRSEFAAVMVCSDADHACPAVPGAAARFALPFDDPKASDGTPHEAETYDERCAQIAREILYVFSQVSVDRPQ